MWRGEESLLCDPGAELRLGGAEKRKGEDNKWDAKKEEKMHWLAGVGYVLCTYRSMQSMYSM